MNKIGWFLFIIFAIVFGGAVLFFQDGLADVYSRLAFNLPKIELRQIEKQIADFKKEVKEIEKQILTPPPLKAKRETQEGFLTQAGAIWQTNLQREKYGLPVLAESQELNASARKKVEDMFKNQYFAHISPSGAGVKDLAEFFGYEFFALGENLAFGNFQNDQILVQAWMDSPGHRENILNANYREIGVAVAKGLFDGQIVWLAVQHFGLPSSACFEPDESLLAEIKENQKQIENLLSDINILQAEIRPAGQRKRFSTDSQKIEEYNILVVKYNFLVEENKKLIIKYNNQVGLFNECVSQIE